MKRIAVLSAIALLFSCGTALADTLVTKPSSGELILYLLICGIMGTVGQLARTIVGLKTFSDYKAGSNGSNPDTATAIFSVSRLIVSQIIGFTSGVLAGLAYWKTQGSWENVDATNFDVIIKFSIAGYIGTDAVEAFTAKYFDPVAASSSMTSGNSRDISGKTSSTSAVLTAIDPLSPTRKISDLATPPVAPAPLPLLTPISSASIAPQQLLGSLSSKYEVGNHGPGTVSSGIGDAGGVSYGSYQMTSLPNGGTVRSFVAQLPGDKRQIFDGLNPGDAKFTSAWKKLAQLDTNGFFLLQHQYIEVTHYDPLVESVVASVTIGNRSFALQNVVWSTAVQHGPKSPILAFTLKGIDFASEQNAPSEFDLLIIKRVYAERGRRDAQGRLVHFSRCSPQVQESVAQRFIDEEKDALAMLAKEQQSSTIASHSDAYSV